MRSALAEAQNQQKIAPEAAGKVTERVKAVKLVI
jgi:hypothetical protein